MVWHGTRPHRLCLRNWLLYGTAGIAFSRDQIDRTQINGTAGKAVAGDVDTELLTRLGVTVGAGVEVGLTPRLSAKLEYRFYDFPSGGVFFTPAAQHYDSDLMLNTLELGLNYKLGNVAMISPKPINNSTSNNWAIHGQTTYTHQYVPGFQSPYVGPQSLVPNQARETWDATLYMGLRLWNGAELWVNPEIDQGFGLSDTHGVAGYQAARLTKSVPPIPMRGWIDTLSDRRSIWAAKLRRLRVRPTSLPGLRPPTVLSSRSANSRDHRMSSTPTNMPTIPAAIF